MDVKTEVLTLLLVIVGVEKESERKSRLTAAGLSFLRADGSGEEVAQRLLDFLIRNGQARMVSFLRALLTVPLLNTETSQRLLELIDEIKALTRQEWLRRLTGIAETTRSYEKAAKPGLENDPSTKSLESPPRSDSSTATGRGLGEVHIEQKVDANNGGTVIGIQQNFNITMGAPGGHRVLTQLLDNKVKPALPTIVEPIRLDVATPNQVTVQQAFDIGVAIKQRHSPSLTIQDLPNVVSEEGEVFRRDDQEIIKYRVAVRSADCEIQNPSFTFHLKAGTDSGVRYFQLIPKRAGQLSIVVDAYQEDELVAATTRVQVAATLEATVA